mmetsp:Transcript_133586/g.427004  ORF Transcript_133586/g.427004 Transcript_133586/m.427004 type:complete len:209 (-) Transcript_133586:173-799(-)|eukprot:CAMPEP_0203872588 /NCGR_PEP_ID=MMETSP0359-20131031/19322_1 /ASSEMBLY_ACC=CAM_ASM_000338 /TAXON_ID=268821 /ORGANISM="Scrippsiella Hangoei, Strain SHTV-5" /LENGTH=208 /DNA_ID=CAMNT_0050791277 /DNA_START=49 /DNA_END=675 /DNA_ORIENTATION=+
MVRMLSNAASRQDAGGEAYSTPKRSTLPSNRLGWWASENGLDQDDVGEFQDERVCFGSASPDLFGREAHLEVHDPWGFEAGLLSNWAGGDGQDDPGEGLDQKPSARVLPPDKALNEEPLAIGAQTFKSATRTCSDTEKLDMLSAGEFPQGSAKAAIAALRPVGSTNVSSAPLAPRPPAQKPDGDRVSSTIRHVHRAFLRQPVLRVSAH